MWLLTVAVCRLAILKRMPATLACENIRFSPAAKSEEKLMFSQGTATPLSDSVGGTSTESASPEKRKGEDLGWFPEVVASSKSSLSEESSTETDFIPEPRAETSKYGRKRTRGKRDNYVS